MRHVWHLFNAAMLLNVVLWFTADTTASKWLHATSAVAVGVAVLATRPKQPPTLR